MTLGTMNIQESTEATLKQFPTKTGALRVLLASLTISGCSDTIYNIETTQLESSSAPLSGVNNGNSTTIEGSHPQAPITSTHNPVSQEDFILHAENNLRNVEVEIIAPENGQILTTLNIGSNGQYELNESELNRNIEAFGLTQNPTVYMRIKGEGDHDSAILLDGVQRNYKQDLFYILSANQLQGTSRIDTTGLVRSQTVLDRRQEDYYEYTAADANSHILEQRMGVVDFRLHTNVGLAQVNKYIEIDSNNNLVVTAVKDFNDVFMKIIQDNSNNLTEVTVIFDSGVNGNREDVVYRANNSYRSERTSTDVPITFSNQGTSVTWEIDNSGYQNGVTLNPNYYGETHLTKNIARKR